MEIEHPIDFLFSPRFVRGRDMKRMLGHLVYLNNEKLRAGILRSSGAAKLARLDSRVRTNRINLTGLSLQNGAYDLSTQSQETQHQ